MRNILICFVLSLQCFLVNIARATTPSDQSTYPVFSFSMVGKERVLLSIYGGTYLVSLKDKSRAKIADRGILVNFDGEKLISISLSPKYKSEISRDLGKNWETIRHPMFNKKCSKYSKLDLFSIPEKKSFDLICDNKIYHTNDYGFSWILLAPLPEKLSSRFWFTRSGSNSSSFIGQGRTKYWTYFDHEKKKWYQLSYDDSKKLNELGLNMSSEPFKDAVRIDDLVLFDASNNFYVKNLGTNQFSLAPELNKEIFGTFLLLGSRDSYWILESIEYEPKKVTLYRYDKLFRLTKIAEFKIAGLENSVIKDVYFDDDGSDYILVDKYDGHWMLLNRSKDEKTWKTILDQNDVSRP